MKLQRSRIAALFATGAALVGAALLQAPAQALPQAPQAPQAEQAVLATTFEDNFDGPAGQAPDSNKWRYDIGGSGWGNAERQYYTNSTRNSAKDGAGNLVITARKESGGFQCHYGTCEYTSARLLTAQTFSQTYGRFEARIKIPGTQGVWPAFWMMGQGGNWPNNGEIDILENIGREPTTVHGTIHGPGYSGAEGIGAAYQSPNGVPFRNDFHTYRVDWSPNVITWYVDGVQYQRRTPADLGGDQWVFDRPHFMIMNVAVGGYWPGYPDGTTVMPQQMLVDYVRVSTLDSSGGNGQITGLAGKCLDVAGANSADGTTVQLYDCNGTAAQSWSRPGDGTIRALGKCLDVANAGTADGTRVQIATCNGNTAQQWSYANNDIVNRGKCLDVTGNNSANATPTQIWTCGGGANQKWTIT
ncbi:glycoside hydrolase family 16 protein [Kribbella albertanoniae]|uniref:Glycosyl hydrolase family protein n=1 Tax=Kribbella albertanoniae TaxID=1266829 RepID=A0A4R4PSN1_9ACTN|nr:glycoside hydrolase family 16 protein [Kribbella albertanoniae]TDC25189.1 glycosyl hydrolase family protein [Kribbella albertanoniae]